MEQFKIGLKVVCIDNSDVENYLIKGNIYTITNISYSTCCNKLLISFGQLEHFIKINCSYCSGTTIDLSSLDKQLLFWRATRFLPLNESEFKKVTYTKIIEEIPISEN